MKPQLPPSPSLRAWSDWTRSSIDAQLHAAQHAQRTLNRAPFALLQWCGLLPPPLASFARLQDALTRTAFQSMVAANRYAEGASRPLLDGARPPRSRRRG